MEVLFLYTELSGYFIACVKALSLQVNEVHIVRWPVNSEAPFDFEFPANVKIYDRKNYSTKELINLAHSIIPDLIICSGWIDKSYLAVCKQFKDRIPTVMGMDNQWQGTLKQRLLCLLSPLTIHRYFSHAWVAGSPQKEYAVKLGFKEKNIQTGIYSADVGLFASETKSRTNAEIYPHRFIYLGRYVQAKGLDLLFSTFTQLVNETNTDWELWCVGTGELYDKRIIHPKIKHLGFMQPLELTKVLRNSGVFILPSRFEPWGVVVHEMAAAGFPMILSSAVGSSSAFLDDGLNGYIFKSDDSESLKTALHKIIVHPDEELKSMSALSANKGANYNPKMWVEKLLSFV